MLEPLHQPGELCTTQCKELPKLCPANIPSPPRRALRKRGARRSTRKERS